MTEPTPDDATAQLPPSTPPDVTAPPPSPAPTPVAAAAQPARTGSTRTILEVVGAAVAAMLIVAAGITGFAVGALVSDRDGHDGQGGRGDRSGIQDFAMPPQGERGPGGGPQFSPRAPGDVESSPNGPSGGGPGGGPRWGDSQE